MVSFGGLLKGAKSGAKSGAKIVAKHPKFVVGGVLAATFLPNLLGLVGPRLPGPLGAAGDLVKALGEAIEWLAENPQMAAAGAVGVVVALHYL